MSVIIQIILLNLLGSFLASLFTYNPFIGKGKCSYCLAVLFLILRFVLVAVGLTYLAYEIVMMEDYFVHLILVLSLLIGFILSVTLILSMCCNDLFFKLGTFVFTPPNLKYLLALHENAFSFKALMLNELKDCSICLKEFTPDSQVIQLKCSHHHIFHEQCMEDYVMTV